jgi:Flp pilus assembly protein TadG
MRMRLLQPWGQRLGCNAGNVLILTGLSFVLLIGAGGAGYDLGRQQLVRQKIQQASDAAALAGASHEDGVSDVVRRQTAQALFTLNYPERYLGVDRPEPTIDVSATTVSVRAQSTMETRFVRVLGKDTLPVNGRSVVAKKARASSLDVVLVMDNSGSMAEPDAGDGFSRNAASDIRARCIAGWIVALKNYDSSYTPDKLQEDAEQRCAADEGATGLTRLNALRFSSVALTNNLLTNNSLNHRIAAITWDDLEIDALDFQSSTSPLITFFDGMYGRLFTNSAVGLSRAEALLSASGRGDNTVTVVILMTDGKNVRDTATDAQSEVVNNQTREVCARLKQRPRTLVFTIAFGQGVFSNGQVKQFLSDCATAPNGGGDPKPNENLYFFTAPDGAALDKAFKQIIGTAQNVRILQ